MKFPGYNGRDNVRATHRLITDALGIPHLKLLTGMSSGAEHSVQFAVSYPDFMTAILPINGGGLWGTQGFFTGSLMTSSIEVCKGWNDGNYDKNPQQCATNAASVQIFYFYTRDWWDQYVDTPEAYTKWRNTWGEYYLDIQDARDLYYRVMAWYRGWIGDTPGFENDLDAIFASIKAKTLFIYNPYDGFYSPQHVELQVKAIRDARAVAIDSIGGHITCCNADPQATREMGDVIREFLIELDGE
jgi:homoserine O-acetyltransferase